MGGGFPSGDPVSGTRATGTRIPGSMGGDFSSGHAMSGTRGTGTRTPESVGSGFPSGPPVSGTWKRTTDRPGFAPRFPWLGGDLQTLRYYFFPARADLSPWPGRRLSFPLQDTGGDTLLAELHRPARAAGRPLVLLVHGLTGCEGSSYMLETARFFLAAGYPVMRLNLRGAGPSRDTCRGSYCAGSGGDVGAVLAALDAEDAGRGVALVGFSLGGAIVMDFLARRAQAVRPICAVTVSAPLALGAAVRRMMRPRNVLYHRWLLARMKAAVSTGAARVSGRERAAVLDARTIREFDDAFTAPRNGFADADDYYARCSVQGVLDRVETPTLLLQARNDPWIPSAPYEDVGRSARPHMAVALTEDGGHVGFHGRRSPTPWYNTVIHAYLEQRSYQTKV